MVGVLERGTSLTNLMWLSESVKVYPLLDCVLRYKPFELAQEWFITIDSNPHVLTNAGTNSGTPEEEVKSQQWLASYPDRRASEWSSGEPISKPE